ncbi:MAG: clostripain-related cysteine peptidase [Elusimicrobiales bacterium]|nr:clostripain-related cysteine peptidase [Elusimicrobiales bacterium]
MIRKLTMTAIAALLMPVQGWSVDFDGSSRGGDIMERISQVELSVPAEAIAAQDQDKGIFDWLFGKKEKAEWTIMVFSSAKNDLERFLLRDINEMELVGSTDKLNIVVEVGRMQGHDASDGDWTGVRRYLIQKDSDMTRMGSRMIQDLGMIDQGDYRNLAAFGKWAKENFPAKKYMLIVSNHGDGWLKNKADENKGISYDEESGNHITTPELAMALREIGKVDVFSTDACLMQMAEVVYEIKDYADFIVGSEETEPGDGYTYNDFLGPIAARPAMTPQEVGRLTVDAYANHYDKINQGYTQSLARASAVGGLLTVSNAFADAMMASGEKALAKTARNAAINYAIGENRDMYDFARRVVEGSQNEQVRAAGQALMDYITGSLMLHNRTRDSQGSFWSGPKQYTLSKGMAAYFPYSGLANGYSELAWARDSRWDEFVTWMNQP